MGSRDGRERFDIQRRLGTGGMGVVYEAIDRERNERVALKTLKHLDASLLYRFKGEFRKLADIAHPNLVRLYELFSVDAEWFFTMELIDGESLLTHVRGGAAADAAPASSPTMPLEGHVGSPVPSRRRGGRVDPGRLGEAFVELARGVEALHSAGRLHRDLKPTNVLVARDGRVVICDFGLVLAHGAAGVFITGEDRLVGTPGYMSPEQAAKRPLTRASDWYSVGVILFEALTGQLPFSGSASDVIRLKNAMDSPRARELASAVPAELDELCARLLARRPEDRAGSEDLFRAFGAQPVRAPGRRPLRSSATAPFVGRASELAVLHGALEEVRGGGTAAWLCRGASGVGKSTLLGHFLDDVRRRPQVVVLEGRCFERESVPYKAFDSLVDALSVQLLSLPRGEAEALVPREISSLARLFPVLRRVDAVAEAPLRSFEAAEPRENRRRAFAALRELLTRLASTRLLVLSIDDLQWGDSDSAALLAALIRPPRPPPLMFLGCCRADEAETGPFVSALEAVQPSTLRRLELGPLPPAEARDLSEAVLGLSPCDVTMAIARESRGNPFFITELARYVDGGAAFELPSGGLQPALEVMLRARLADLPPEARTLLEVIAVAGRALSRSVAVQAAVIAGSELLTVDLLREQRLLRTSSGGRGEALEIWHDRIRETVVACIGASALRDHHARLATALRASRDPDPQELVDHLIAAGQPEQAYRQAVAAALRAAEALAFDRAAALLALAIELAPVGGQDVRNLKRQLGEALASAGKGADSARAYLDALEGAEPAEHLELRRRAAEQLLRSGHFEEGLVVIGGVLSDVGLSLPLTPRSALATLVWRRALRRVRGLRFRERGEADIAPAVLRRLDVCWTAGIGLSLIDLVRGESFQTHHLLMALRAGEPYRIARAVALETVYIASSGRFHERASSELSARATELAERAGKPHGRALALVVSGIVSFMAGRWSEGLSKCHSAESIFLEQCTGVSWELATTNYFELACLYYMGELGELSARVPQLLREAEERSDLYAATSLRTWPSNIVWLARDEPVTARAEIELAMKRWSYGGFQLQHVRELFADMQVDLYEGEAGRALARFDACRNAVKTSLLLRARNLHLSAVHLEARAHLQLTARAQRSAASSSALDRAVRTMRAAGPLWSKALGSLIEAGKLATTEDAEGSAARFADAARQCQEAGLGLFAAASRRRSGELRESRATIEEADAWMRARGVLNPLRMTMLLAPGAA